MCSRLGCFREVNNKTDVSIIRKIIEDFDFIIVKENFENDILILNNFLNNKFKKNIKLNYYNENSISNMYKDKIDNNLRKKIKKYCTYDFMLYNEVLNKRLLKYNNN